MGPDSEILKSRPTLTYAPPDFHTTVLQRLTTQGTSSLAEGLHLLLKETMALVRSAALKAASNFSVW
jgi:hypothetical protein